MKDFKDFKYLNVLQKAHELAVAVYSASRTFPREEIYGLTSQLRRAGCLDGREYSRRLRAPF